MADSGDDPNSIEGRRKKLAPGGDSEPPRPGIGAGVKTLLLSVVIIGVSYGFYVSSDKAPSRILAPADKKREIILVSGRDIARELIGFLEPLRGKEEFFGSIECKPGNECKPTDPGLLPVAAWQILGAAGIANLGDKAKASEIATFYYNKWIRRADMSLEDVSLHQLFEGFLAIGDENLFWAGWPRTVDFLRQFASRERAGMNQSPHAEMPPLVATMSRQFAQAAAALRDPKQLAILNTDPNIPHDETARKELHDDLVRISVRLATEASNSPANNSFGADLMEKPKLGLFACWVPWATLALYEATGEQRYLDEVLGFFRSASFATRSKSDVNGDLLQAILPCLDVLARLKDRDSSFLPSLHFLIESFVLPNWDFSKDPLFNGDGGFFPRIGDLAMFRREPQRKTVSDNAWLLFVLSKVPNETFRYSVREI